MVRLRFAPSPTGFLHVGGLRTALFCWLYARQNSGKFIFRLEDTDQKRLVAGSEKDLVEMLDWAGIDLDEGPGLGGEYGPYRQSERLDIYWQYAQQLLDENNAYPCFCSSERLTKLREEQRKKGEIQGYDRFCRKINKKESDQRIASGEKYVIRMKIPETPELLEVNDLIRLKVSIDTRNSEDQVIVKSDGFPTYHLAVVVDDYLMKITHVVRGEEWLPSFPKHLLLYRYFGWSPPKFAHLPLILNPDRSKLSKRQEAVAIEDFRDQGYLAETLVNFISLLGWSPPGNNELFTLRELVEQFSFERVNKSGAIFDRNKLNWMNQQYIQNLDQSDFIKRVMPFLVKTEYAEKNSDLLQKAISILQPRLVNLSEIANRLSLFFDEEHHVSDPEVVELLKKDSSKLILSEFIRQLKYVESLNEENLANVVKKVQEVTSIRGKDLWIPLRYAITLEKQGPDLKLLVDFFGKEKCIQMVQNAIEL